MNMTDWTLEVPVTVGSIIADRAQIEATLVLNEDGGLHKVGVHQLNGDGRHWLLGESKDPWPSLIWDIAQEVMEEHGDEIRERAGYVDVSERPDYTGREYHPLTF